MILGEELLHLHNVQTVLQIMNSKGRVCAYFKVVSPGGIEKSYERPLVHAEILLQNLHNMK
jgi:hypothetical protein